VKSDLQSIRDAYAEILLELGSQHPELVVLDADGARTHRTEQFGRAYPERFFDLGIAEQNTVAVAAGMASAGKVPVATMFANFAALRALEQIKTLISYPRLNVKIVGGYAGVSDGPDGPTHHCLMDLAAIRALPNMVVLTPSDTNAVRASMVAALRHRGPMYIRLVYGTFGTYHQAGCDLRVGRGTILAEGQDVTILASGPVLDEVMLAREFLQKSGIAARVVDLFSIKPLDDTLILQSALETGTLVTVEEHSVIGGIGEAVASLVSAHFPVPVERLGYPDRHLESAPYSALVDRYGPSAAAIVRGVERAMARKHGA
jgi:transketolase